MCLNQVPKVFDDMRLPQGGNHLLGLLTFFDFRWINIQTANNMPDKQTADGKHLCLSSHSSDGTASRMVVHSNRGCLGNQPGNSTPFEAFTIQLAKHNKSETQTVSEPPNSYCLINGKAQQFVPASVFRPGTAAPFWTGSLMTRAH